MGEENIVTKMIRREQNWLRMHGALKDIMRQKETEGLRQYETNDHWPPEYPVQRRCQGVRWEEGKGFLVSRNLRENESCNIERPPI
ncbi:hypothetical protein JTB14_023875 [Gonioctena quinquepunctata]|nr:hypothetical protein JTB14_023875 [Gonioctena quinquepunctata]